MSTVKGFWQHENGKIYVIESDSFGKIIAGVGPVNPHKQYDPEQYECKQVIVDWLEQALSQNKLHRYKP